MVKLWLTNGIQMCIRDSPTSLVPKCLYRNATLGSRPSSIVSRCCNHSLQYVWILSFMENNFRRYVQYKNCKCPSDTAAVGPGKYGTLKSIDQISRLFRRYSGLAHTTGVKSIRKWWYFLGLVHKRCVSWKPTFRSLHSYPRTAKVTVDWSSISKNCKENHRTHLRSYRKFLC